MKLNYKKLGHGKPLVILHGLFGSLDNWLSYGKHWSNKYEVWLIDQRNHGLSDHSDSFSYPILAQDLNDFLKQHSIVNPIIIGHSMGGKTLMEFSLLYPNNIEKQIIVDIAPVHYEVHHASLIHAMESLDVSKIKSRKEADEALKNAIQDLGVRQFLLKNLYWKTKEQLDWKFNLKAIKENIDEISSWYELGLSSNVPTLFIKGGRSNYIENKYELEMKEKFPNSTILVIQDAGHWIHAEKPRDFIKAVEDFMKD